MPIQYQVPDRGGDFSVRVQEVPNELVEGYEEPSAD